MLGIGFGEFALIFIVLIVVLGPERLPTFMRSVGKGLRTLRQASRDIRSAVGIDELLNDQTLYEPPKPRPRPQPVRGALPAQGVAAGEPDGRSGTDSADPHGQLADVGASTGPSGAGSGAGSVPGAQPWAPQPPPPQPSPDAGEPLHSRTPPVASGSGNPASAAGPSTPTAPGPVPSEPTEPRTENPESSALASTPGPNTARPTSGRVAPAPVPAGTVGNGGEASPIEQGAAQGGPSTGQEPVAPGSDGSKGKDS